MSRSLRLAGYVGLGIAGGLLLAALLIALLTRTDWGMERARGFAVRWLEQRIEGELRIGRVTGPGLLGGVVIHDFGIVDPRGRPFLSTDSLELAYDWRTLLAGRIVLNRVVLYQPRLYMERLPGDDQWNYERVFPPGEPAEPGRRSLILFNDARIINGNVVIRTPFEPAGPNAPGDTARLILEQVPGGIARTVRFEDVNARLDRVIWESPLEPGRLFDVQMLQARGFIWRDPIVVRNARGSVTTRDSVITFDMPDVSLPASNASILGRVVMREGRDDIDARVEARRLAFSDLQWLYPNLPQEGGGSLRLRIQSQPDGMLWLAEDAQLQAPGTRVAGSFGVVTGDTLYFTQVNLRASPLDVQLLEQILPGGLPVEGLLVGTVEVRGPLSALETRGDVQFAGGPGAGSKVAWRGVLDVRDGNFAARSLRADVSQLELALLRAFNPDLDIAGSVSGRIEGSGRLDRLTFTAALEHESSGGQSVFDGSGTVTGAGSARTFDVLVNASAVTLEDLAVQAPALRGMRGALRGPLHVSGSAADFAFNADLDTPGGALQLGGRVRRHGGEPHVEAVARAAGFRLHALRTELPETVVTGRLVVDVRGNDMATAAGSVQLAFDSARVRSFPVGAVQASGTLADGLLHVDSAALYTVAGLGRATGSIGLVAGRSGTVEAGFTSESLTPLEAQVFGSLRRAADEEPRLAGRLDAVARVTGWVGDLDVQARALFDRPVYGNSSAARLRVEAEAAIENEGSRFWLTAFADSLNALAHSFQRASVEAVQDGDSLHVTVAAADGLAERLRAVAAMHTVDEASGRARTLRLDDVRIGSGSPWLLSAPATFLLQGSTAELDGLELRRAAGGRVTAAGRLAYAATPAAAAEPMSFRLDLENTPFTEVLGALRSRASGAGLVNGTVRVSGSAADPVVEAELAGQALHYGDVRIDRAFAEASYAFRSLDVHAEAQYGGRSIITGGGRIPLDLSFAPVATRRLDEALQFTLTADSLPPAVPLGLIDGFSNVGGRIDGTLAFSGTTLEPALSGGMVLRGGVADWDVTGVRYHDVRGTFILEDDRTVGVDVRARTADPRGRSLRARQGGGGEGRIRGTLDLTDLTDPGFRLTLAADRTYAARRRDVEAFVSGDMQLGGRYSSPELSGSLRVDNGALFLDELYRQYLIVGLELDDPSLLSLVDTSLVAVRPLLAASQNPFMRNLQVRGLEVVVGSDSWLRSRDMDVEVTGNLNVTFNRRDEDLRLLGLLTVERGTYTLYYPPLQSRRFQVRSGTIEFPGTPGMDPNLAITAAYRVRSQSEPLDVLAVVSGTLQSPRVRLTSDAQPPISESDLASYIFFGVPTWQVANIGGTGAGNMAGLALRPSVLGFASSGLQSLVQSAGLFDYVGLTAAEASPGRRDQPGFGGLFNDTQLELGRYLPGTNIYVGYTQRLGSAGGEPAGRVEWRFLPEFTLELFVEDRFARAPGFGLRSEPGVRKVYGFSLFREWGF